MKRRWGCCSSSPRCWRCPSSSGRRARCCGCLLGLLLLSRGLLPYLNTADRMIAAGHRHRGGLQPALPAASAACRTSGAVRRRAGAGGGPVGPAARGGRGHRSIRSPRPAAGPAGCWVCCCSVCCCWQSPGAAPPRSRKGHSKTLAILGIYLVLTLVYFAFSAPAVIARWTEGNYTLIVSAVSLFSLGSAWLIASPSAAARRACRCACWCSGTCSSPSA